VKRISEIERLLRDMVRDEVRAAFAERGDPAAREYSSAGPLPAGTSRRVFAREARAMIAVGASGVRREGRGLRDRLYIVAAVAWHRWRTSARTIQRHDEPTDSDLAAAALKGAGLHLRAVRGSR
jgi:hypothetical protein